MHTACIHTLVSKTSEGSYGPLNKQCFGWRSLAGHGSPLASVSISPRKHCQRGALLLKRQRTATPGSKQGHPIESLSLASPPEASVLAMCQLLEGLQNSAERAARGKQTQRPRICFCAHEGFVHFEQDANTPKQASHGSLMIREEAIKWLGHVQTGSDYDTEVGCLLPGWIGRIKSQLG